MTTAFNYDSYQTQALPLRVQEPRCKFDPDSKDFRFIVIRFSSNDTPALTTVEESYKNLRTEIKTEFNDEWKSLETTIAYKTPLWSKLPTLADYVDIDSLYDPDEVEEAFFKAGKNLGW